tara:strand:+ start:198 stop:743 length:546 start_codon:yes stop_codon:yes gene_type:complete
MELTGKCKEEPKDTYVYKHIDNNGVVFYVGQGAKRRPYDKYGRSEAWKNVAKNGYTIEIVDVLSKNKAFALEKKIQLEIGIENLVNQNIGSSFIHTKESKEKISKAKTGAKRVMMGKRKPPTAQALINMSNAQKGRRHSEITKAKMVNSAKKRWQEARAAAIEKANEIRNKQLNTKTSIIK